MFELLAQAVVLRWAITFGLSVIVWTLFAVYMCFRLAAEGAWLPLVILAMLAIGIIALIACAWERQPRLQTADELCAEARAAHERRWINVTDTVPGSPMRVSPADRWLTAAIRRRAR